MEPELKEKLTAYDIAIRQVPDDVLQAKAEWHHKFMELNMEPLKIKMGTLRMMQDKKMVWEDGKRVSSIKWTPESRKIRDNIQKQMDRVHKIAEDHFWKGYEHLKPGTDGN